MLLFRHFKARPISVILNRMSQSNLRFAVRRLAIHLPLTKVLGSLMVVPCAFIGPVGKETPHNDGVMEDLSLKHAQSPVLPSTRFATDGLETTALMREGWPRQLAWWPIPLLLLTIAALWAAKELP